MATTNITKQFKSLITDTIRFRATVLQIDEALSRVKVEWGESQQWVTSTLSLTVGDQVCVEDTNVISKLPSLDFASLEVN
ncbi:hypothetical protein OW492_00535 [Psychromonas sp. 14N.309.X.WAT.B.A12]|uniref:hypothetical protein n=1 Tax=Psychromonas sp. 14N.309.X.WAT.B.A12 TaxID=2998322 RepID=UPI0025B25D68|nr:hypothetical protein [Psychromonas sp. 14N.309.X.WAT.B.A12]MDN2661858.1 hypothetical protein [Psychromonas sp. 14N.309.X.WAT.B.A12]